MLKRIYIDNFRCLINFDLSFNDINLFLGPNGSGKSTVFDVLRKIQAFVNGEKLSDLFDVDHLTAWQALSVQTFELEISGNGGLYKYQLAIDIPRTGPTQHVKRVYERLFFDDKPLFVVADGQLKMYLDDHLLHTTLPYDTSLPSAFLFSTEQYSKLSWFKERINRFIIVQINPMTMIEESKEEEERLTSRMENFVSWYRYIYQNQGKAIEITKALQEVFNEFNYFKFSRVGQKNRILKLYFSKNNGHQNAIEYSFSQLSDGDRALVALYTLIHYARFGDYTLCIDEPENFLALPEIQPWLMELDDFCGDDNLQALLISHHPDLIDFLAESGGYWFDREHNTPTRVSRLNNDESAGFPISKLVARGWING